MGEIQRRKKNMYHMGIIRLRNAGFWMLVLLRHFFRQPGILIPFAGILAGTFLLTLADTGVPTQIRAAVCTDESAFAKEIYRQLIQGDSKIQFYRCENRGQLERDVASGKAESGYYLEDEIRIQLESGSLEHIIDSVRAPGSIVKNITDELVFASILSVYSPQLYADYMVKMLTAKDADSKERQAAADAALAGYEGYRNNQSTFQFQFTGGSPGGQSGQISFFRLRGIIAVMILAAALCAVAVYQKDCALNRFLCANHRWAVELFCYVIAITAACLTGLAGLRLTPEWSGMSAELKAMSIYAVCLVLLCMIISRILPSEKWVISFLPFATAGSLILSPVFWDITVLFPFAKVLTWGTPVTLYLSLI